MDPISPNDEFRHLRELAQKAREGESAALERFCAELRPRLRQWAELELAGRSPARFDASDIAQVALTSIVRNIAQCLGDSDPGFARWIRQALHRDVIDAIRQGMAQKRGPQRPQSLNDTGGLGVPLAERMAGNGPTPSHEAMARDESRRVEEAMANLTLEQQRAVRLVYLEGLRPAEAAQAMGTTADAVRQLLKRALLKLRGVLVPRQGDPGDAPQ